MLFAVTGTRFVWVHAADEREALERAAGEHKLTDCTAKLVKYTTPPVVLDINSLDPLDHCHLRDANSDLQADVDRERDRRGARENGWEAL